ncbi:MAG: hypothetical protein AB8G05_03295 [Oligoflexales bacterium]
MNYYLLILNIMLSVSCAGSSSSSRSRSSGEQVRIDSLNGTAVQTRDELIKELLNRESELNYGNFELAKLEPINQAMCEKTNQINKECLPLKAITSNAMVRLVNCDGNSVEQASNSKIEVDIYIAGSGNFKLAFHSANSVYESIALKTGTQDLKFSNLVDDQVLTPSFADIQRMRFIVDSLSADNGETATATIDIIVDGQSILKDTIPEIVVGESYEMNVKDLYQQLISPACHLSNESLEELLAPFKSSSEGSVENAPSGIRSAEQNNYQNESTANIQQKISLVEDTLAELKPKLRLARDRNTNLRQTIMGGTGVGCRLKQKIESLSISIDGSPIIDHVDSKRDDKVEGSGNAKELEIDLGGVSFSSTTVLGSTFVPDEDLSSLDISSLTRVSLQKGGTSFINTLIKCKGGFFGSLKLDNDCYEVKEESAMEINKITLEVNGITLFEEGNLGLKLYRDQMSWSFDNIQLHPQWGEMLLRNDCDATN